MSDTALVQAAVNCGTVLRPGTYMLSSTITVGQYQALRGSGGDTYLLPEATGYPLVTLTGSSPTVKDIHLGRFDWAIAAKSAISASGGLDRILIENVWADGKYDSAVLVISNCHSSSIRHSTFWQYMNEKFTAIFDSSSDWSLFQAEFHQHSLQTTSKTIWLTNGCSAIRFFGGNVSHKAGNGSPGYLDDAGAAAMVYGTTFYQEP